MSFCNFNTDTAAECADFACAFAGIERNIHFAASALNTESFAGV